jgi:hypothetical protein
MASPEEAMPAAAPSGAAAKDAPMGQATAEGGLSAAGCAGAAAGCTGGESDKSRTPAKQAVGLSSSSGSSSPDDEEEEDSSPAGAVGPAEREEPELPAMDPDQLYWSRPGLSKAEQTARVKEARRQAQKPGPRDFVVVQSMLAMSVVARMLLLPFLKRDGEHLLSVDVLSGGDITDSNEDITNRCSHMMSKVLRHGCQGLTFRIDGFVRLADLLKAANSRFAGRAG